MGNPVMWFEVAAKDREAMKGFYGELFDWKLSEMDGMPYTMAETGGSVPGGIGPTPEGYDGHATFYVEVDDVAAALAQAESLGGNRLMEPMTLPRGGVIALFADPEGNSVGLMDMSGAS